MKALTWYIGNNLYGLFLQDIIEVVEGIKYIEAPQGPPSIMGLFNLRGEIITVLNLQEIFFKASYQNEKNINMVRVKRGRGNIGIAAENIHEIYEIKKEDIKETPINIKVSHTRYIKNVAYVDQKLVLIINLDEIVE